MPMDLRASTRSDFFYFSSSLFGMHSTIAADEKVRPLPVSWASQRETNKNSVNFKRCESHDRL